MNMTAMTKEEARGDAGRVQAERHGRRRPRRRDDHPGRQAATASRSRISATRRACAPTATAAPAWSRSRASACWRRPAAASPAKGMEVTTDSARAVQSQKMVLELLLSDMPEERHTRNSELDHWARQLDVGKPRFAPRHQPPADSLAPRHRGQSRFLHPVHALRARLPRGAGERRDRLRVPRRALEDRVRPRRPDGRVDLRRLRRMRAGLPDRRADAGARRGHGRRRQAGALGLPVLRRRLPAHLSRQGQQDPVRRRPRRPVEPQPPVRQGPLRLRLRATTSSA